MQGQSAITSKVGCINISSCKFCQLLASVYYNIYFAQSFVINCIASQYNCLMALYVIQRLAVAGFVSSHLPLFRLARKVGLVATVSYQLNVVVSFFCICSDTKRDRCGMYPKKTLSAASLLSECERKRRRSLEALGCAKSESEFSMGTAATCPFPMSEQSPRSIKLHQSVYARSNDQALRQTEI